MASIRRSSSRVRGGRQGRSGVRPIDLPSRVTGVTNCCTSLIVRFRYAHAPPGIAPFAVPRAPRSPARPQRRPRPRHATAPISSAPTSAIPPRVLVRVQCEPLLQLGSRPSWPPGMSVPPVGTWRRRRALTTCPWASPSIMARPWSSAATWRPPSPPASPPLSSAIGGHGSVAPPAAGVFDVHGGEHASAWHPASGEETARVRPTGAPPNARHNILTLGPF